MFDDDLTLLSTADLLESSAEHRAMANRADARVLEHALVYADRFHPDACTPRPGRRSVDGRECAVVLGGEGCPEIAEFAIAEYAAVLGVSHRIGAKIIGDALALRHRFPFTWARVLSGDATPWKACRLVRDCVDLSEEAARYVDQRVAALIDTITPYRLDKIVKAAKMHIDPEGARAEAAAKVRERGVFIGRSDEHGTKTIYIRTSSGAATRFDATIHALSDAQQTLGDTRSTQIRRAESVGIIADPIFAQELLTQAHHHPTPSPAPHPPTPPAPADAPAAAPAAAPVAAAPTPPPATSAPDTSTPQPPASRNATPAPGDSTADTSAPGSPVPDTAAPTANTATAHTGASRAAATPTSTSNARTQSAATPDAPGGDGWVVGDEPVPDEPGPDDEADRDAPHPSNSDQPDPLDHTDRRPDHLAEPFPADTDHEPDDGEPMDAAAQRALASRLAQIKHDAYARLASIQPPDTPARPGTPTRPGKTEIYVHLTDHTLASGDGVLRAEEIGPLLATQLSELIGYSPYTVKPVIDLNHAVSVNCYEASERIRERVKLTHPVELFPYGTRETNHSIDLDHLKPYDPLGPPGQTNTQNLAPLGRYAHRVKTHARGWNVRRINPTTLEWTTPHGFVFHVDPTGTHRVVPGSQD
ncbi:hypothetical protein ACFTSF_21235 [Kribbella sp. NPDC056951]|uniref:hypothetical protein n=1 Tax=Kribbella sp. NPDC056951 TaxID=3345978 RepID=UPI0036260F4D